MEAVAKYAYTSSSPSELSFKAGETMKIIPYDEFWCRGRINGKDGYVPKSYITEKPHSWFKGKITREESEELLLKRDKTSQLFKHIDGAFLIRHSENSPEDFSASVKYVCLDIYFFSLFMSILKHANKSEKYKKRFDILVIF